MTSTPRRRARKALILLPLLLLLGCNSEPDMERVPIEAKPAWKGPIEVVAGEGDQIVLVGPKIPVHPSYADAKTEAKFDTEHLRLDDQVRDTGSYGFSVIRFTFAVLRDGESEVEFVVRRDPAAPPDPAPEPTATYRIAPAK